MRKWEAQTTGQMRQALSRGVTETPVEQHECWISSRMRRSSLDVDANFPLRMGAGGVYLNIYSDYDKCVVQARVQGVVSSPSRIEHLAVNGEYVMGCFIVCRRSCPYA